MKTRTVADKDATYFLESSCLLSQLYFRSNRLALARLYCAIAVTGYKRILAQAGQQEDLTKEQNQYYTLVALL